jgi:DinB superfamily
MKETPQQYIQRILSYLGGQDPLDIQARTPKQLERAIEGAASSRLRRRPAPEKWSIAEILAHLADVEIVVSWRIRAILGAPGTSLQAMDQDAWVAAGHYDKRDPRKSVEAFRVLREMNLALFDTLTPEQWQHHGMHSERGAESVEQIVRLYAGHDLNHTRQIEQILASSAT